MNLDRARGWLRLEGDGRLLIDRIAVADRFGLRARGLMFRDRVPEAFGVGLFFPRCREVHTCFMRFDLDVWFLDAEGRVLEVRRAIPPWRIVRGPRGTRHCLESRAGTLPAVAAGKMEWMVG